jgi:hypothetical protein
MTSISEKEFFQAYKTLNLGQELMKNGSSATFDIIKTILHHFGLKIAESSPENVKNCGNDIKRLKVAFKCLLKKVKKTNSMSRSNLFGVTVFFSETRYPSIVVQSVETKHSGASAAVALDTSFHMDSHDR